MAVIVYSQKARLHPKAQFHYFLNIHLYTVYIAFPQSWVDENIFIIRKYIRSVYMQCCANFRNQYIFIKLDKREDLMQLSNHRSLNYLYVENQFGYHKYRNIKILLQVILMNILTVSINIECSLISVLIDFCWFLIKIVFYIYIHLSDILCRNGFILFLMKLSLYVIREETAHLRCSVKVCFRFFAIYVIYVMLFNTTEVL